MLCVFENLLTDSCCEVLPSQGFVLFLRLSEQGTREAADCLSSSGAGEVGVSVGIGAGLGVSSPGPTTHTNGLTPVHLTLFTVRPETFTSRLLSDPFSQVHQSQKQKSARNSRKNE